MISHMNEGDQPDIIEGFTDDQAFSPSYELAPPPLSPTPSPVNKLDTERLRKRDNLLTVEGGGGGVGRSQSIRWRESLVLFDVVLLGSTTQNHTVKMAYFS